MTSYRVLRAPFAQWAFVLCSAPCAFAQDQAAQPPATVPLEAQTEVAPSVPSPGSGKQRIAGILPNYNTIDASLPFERIGPSQKLRIAWKDATDMPVFFLPFLFAGLSQMQNSNPEFGQGLGGYGKRYAASLGDRSIGNIMTEGVYPVLFHQDPRYFRKGSGPGMKRLFYAVSRVVIAKNDKGNWTFNASEFAGNGTAVAISNLYYYGEESRTASSNVTRLCIQVAGDAGSNVLREFWPDIRAKLFRKKP